jgi:hypothetical protein
VKGLSRGTLSSEPASVEVVPVLGAGSSATLRDIKEPVRGTAPDPLELALGLLALTGVGWLTWRARHRAPRTVAEPEGLPAVAPPPPDPYEIALDRLTAIERERWSTRDVARHYAEATDVLRDYLETHGVPARERTTTELRWSLPPRLLRGPRGRGFDRLFHQADLVKFACCRPTAIDAAAFLRDARSLLVEWRDGLRSDVLEQYVVETVEATRAVR